MNAREMINGLIGGRHPIQVWNVALDTYATEVETESWKRALDHVTHVLELVPLDLRAPLPDVTEKLEAQLVKLIDRLTLGEQARDRVNALNAAGVDNWEGYGYAMRILHGEDEDE